MIKNLTILRRDYLKRSSKSGYFSNASDYIILENATDLKVKKELKELNKTYKVHLFNIEKRFVFTKKSDINTFIKYYVDNKNNIRELKQYENLTIELIKEI